MRAILSVSDKTNLVDFARALAARGVQLVSTGGTAKTLMDNGLPVTNVSEVTGFPEMMDGRVKTLHPKVHAGILARRSRPDDLEAIRAQGVELVDLVVVNLYPFARAAANPETPFDELVEQIDIGGPSLLRAAGKNFRDVMVVVDPADYSRVIDQLGSSDGPTLPFKFELMQKAFAHTAQFDALIAQTLAGIVCEGESFLRRASVPASLERAVAGSTGSHHGHVRQLRYGENPHQKAMWATGHGPAWRVKWETLQGKELSYTNLLDLDAAARIALEFTEPAGVVIKHTNPCGTATGAAIAEAYIRAREADPLSAFGGIVGLNREVDLETATALTATFIEAVIAPSIAEAARPILAKKPNMRVVTADFAEMANVPTMVGSGELAHGTEMRTILGGTLHQEPDRVTEARDPWPPAVNSQLPTPNSQGPAFPIRVVTKRQPTPEEWTALRFAWRVCAHVKSNTIVFTAADRTLAIGAGQMSRVDAVKVAVMKAAPGSLKGSVAASDAFFPFRDGLDAIAAAGATAVVQPGGSVKDAEVIAAADEHGLAMVFTGRRHFRH